jgi:serine/threonine protein kinase
VDGTPFGRYRLIELLGRGGMGEVWRAHDAETDRVVAIKLLPAHFSGNQDFKQRFRREAHAAARLNSPHVIPIHDYGEIEGRLYVNMRLIEGRDLQTVLAEGPLEPARAVRIIEGVALALHAAHEVGLLHRDVKPSNILLDRHDFAYLIDFGIARAADETRLTKSGNAIGTFAYIAPERLGSRAEEDARADIYSLACVLYECLTGRPPFDEATMAGLVAAHLNTPPPQPSTTHPTVPGQIDQVIATGMAKDPDNRYATTVELADAARDAITAPIPRPTPSPPTPPTEQAGSVTAPWDHGKPLQPPPTAFAPATQRRAEPLPAYAGQLGAAAEHHPSASKTSAPNAAPPVADNMPLFGRLSRRTKLMVVAIAMMVIATVATVAVVTTGRSKSGRPPPTPENFQGVWEGSSNMDSGGAPTIRLMIDSSNRLDGTIEYLSYTCTETWHETGRNGSTILVAESYASGNSECRASKWEVTVANGTLSGRSTTPGDAVNQITLKKNVA